jgi:hypothetical protein
MTDIEISIDIIHDLIISMDQGMINPSDTYIINVFDTKDFNEMIEKINDHFNGTIEEIDVEYGEGYGILWIENKYILICYSRRFNNSYSIDIMGYNFRYEIDRYLNIGEIKMDEEPIGICEDN